MNRNEETLDLLKKSQTEPSETLAKAYTQSATATSGITAYDLAGPAKKLYPVLTPLRNEIARRVGGVGIQANWRAVTGINTGGAGVGVSQGNRGVVIAQSTKDYTAAFKTLGLENYATFEADLAGKGFDDVKALAVMNLLDALMIGEEQIILGGNSGIALGTTPTPSLTAATSGGAIADSTAVYVLAVALTHEAYINATVAGGLPLSGSRTLADGSTETYNAGTAIVSSSANVTTGSSGSNANKISASVSPVNGAVAYAWFWGASAAAATLGAITTISKYDITTAAGTGTQVKGTSFDADKSQNSLVFDGFFSQLMASGSGSYVKTLDGASTLTGDGIGGIVEIDAALQSFWDNYRLSPDEIWVSSQEQQNITTKIGNGNANGTFRFSKNVADGQLEAGAIVPTYKNKFAMGGNKNLEIKLHPYMPAGTMFFRSKTLPYALSNVSELTRILLRQDYYQIEWPLRSRKYEYGVYMDGVLQNFFPPAFGLIRNIKNG